MQMYWEMVRFLVCLCLVGFAAAAKCVPEICGSMTVSYPFWIHNPDCGQPGFQLKCKEDKSTGKLALFLPAVVSTTAYTSYQNYPKEDFKIMKINYRGHLTINSTSLKAFPCGGDADAAKVFQLPPDGPFTISTANRFVVIGCHTSGSYTFKDYGEARCVSMCDSRSDSAYCNYGCCENVLPDNWKWINFTGGGWFKYSKETQFCGFSTILDPSTFTVVDNNTNLFWGLGKKAYYGLRLNWGISFQNCSMAKSTANYSCDVNAECINSPSEKGHVCKCLRGYEGNGYSNGTLCIDVDECNNREKNECVGSLEGGVCQNFPGSYNCSCKKGYSGDGFLNGTRCQSPARSNNSAISATIGSVSSLVAVSLGACALFWCLRRRSLRHARDKYFKQNGGIQLQEDVASMGGRKGLTIFSEKELEIASKNYSTELGRGGFAIVYRGVLSDGRPVAIKKPKAISGPEFINEIIIFSHINHRNIVKLLGCCLQTQYPLLVYEFVPNGTLFEHLHSEEKHLSWETRQQIAIEAADAISYMHFQASQPIFHRDIKSSNILLDDTFTPKVADFGISRLRPSDEPHLSTMAAGTPGYLDPGFVKSNQFTDKSDVFSFGVVLVELLTGLKPLLSLEIGTVCTLYDHFLSKINNNRLAEILDSNIVNKENQAQMENVARLAEACLKAKGRPSMKEVVEELAWIRDATKRSGVYRNASLVERRDNPTQEKMFDYTFKGAGESTSADPYLWPNPSEIITSEDPSTTLIQIQMPDMYAR